METVAQNMLANVVAAKDQLSAIYGTSDDAEFLYRVSQLDWLLFQAEEILRGLNNGETD